MLEELCGASKKLYYTCNILIKTSSLILDYSNWNSVKIAINDKRSYNKSQPKKRANHWKDFLGNIVRLKFIDNNKISPNISNESTTVKSLGSKTETNIVTQRLIESDKSKCTENEISAEKYGSNMVTAPVETCISSVNNFTSIGNDSKQDVYRKKNTLPQIATANLAFSISSLFDKNFNVQTKSVSIYPKKCPCQRCQALRKINRFRRTHE